MALKKRLKAREEFYLKDGTLIINDSPKVTNLIIKSASEVQKELEGTQEKELKDGSSSTQE